MPSAVSQPGGEFPYAAVGRRLREERERRGWSRVDLARQARIDQSPISKYEKGRTLPSAWARQRLEDAFEWPSGRIMRLAEQAEEPRSLEDFLAGRPLLTDDDRQIVLALVAHLEGRNVLDPG